MDPNTLDVTEQPEVFAFTRIRDLVNQTLNQDFGTRTIPDGVSSGFRELDKATGGFQKGRLYTIAVKPGMGKTAFLLSLANNMAIKNNEAVAIFSSERSNIKMTKRIIESETGMSVHKLQAQNFKASERDHMLSLLSNIAKARIFIDDTPSLTAGALSAKARQLQQTQGVDLIIVDYLELLGTGGQDGADRQTQLASIMQSIKSIAMELMLPVVLFSQTAGHEQGYRAGDRPSLKSLPAFLSENSDVLMLLHRSDAYPPLTIKGNRNNVELLVSGGETTLEEEAVPLAFIESIAKFTDLS